MAKSRILLLFLLLTIFGISAVAENKDREPAPRFNAKTMTGERFSNDSLKGKVVLLQFWATWCPYCAQEQRFVDKLQQEYADQGFLVLAVDVGESRKTVKRYLEENPRSVRIVLTADTNLAAMYAATQYPIYVLIDRDGNIAAEQKGAAGERVLRRMLAQAGLAPDREGGR